MKPIDRKQELVAQAAIHRQRVEQARETLVAGIRPATLMKGVGGLALTGLALLRSRKEEPSPAGLTSLLPVLAPLALKGISLVGKKAKSPKPTMRQLLLVGALGAVTAFAVKKAVARRRAK
ncbi:hypothetical protein EDC30_11075 [Paucimonas lemoignei]|uniref:Uncharacterized protein n=1 Tax=Paucimonas lemoignei TaxID=29443 RepID=A0A4R3HR78_PAULE|nr:hypothetical protein [Paucimonas lemoignei]TCS35607.1 hypothetical protein EDC30_11075 [Paucimonas lemoignei]